MGEHISFSCLVGTDGEAGAGDVGDDGIEAGGASKAEPLWPEETTGARKQDSTFSTKLNSIKSPFTSPGWAKWVILWRESGSSSSSISSSSKTTVADLSVISFITGGFSLASALEVCFLFGSFPLGWGHWEDVPSQEARAASWALFRSRTSWTRYWSTLGSCETTMVGQIADPFGRPICFW